MLTGKDNIVSSFDSLYTQNIKERNGGGSGNVAGNTECNMHRILFYDLLFNQQIFNKSWVWLQLSFWESKTCTRVLVYWHWKQEIENILYKLILRVCFVMSSNDELKGDRVPWPSGLNSLDFLLLFPLLSFCP